MIGHAQKKELNRQTDPAPLLYDVALVTPNCRLRFFFFNDTATTEIYTVSDTLSLHDALPISPSARNAARRTVRGCRRVHHARCGRREPVGGGDGTICRRDARGGEGHRRGRRRVRCRAHPRPRQRHAARRRTRARQSARGAGRVASGRAAPLAARRARLAGQTATGSRYSPKTPRRTPHISPSVAYASAARRKWGIRLVSVEPGRVAESRSPASAASTASASRSRRVRSRRASWRSRDPAGTASTGTVVSSLSST